MTCAMRDCLTDACSRQVRPAAEMPTPSGSTLGATGLRGTLKCSHSLRNPLPRVKAPEVILWPFELSDRCIVILCDPISGPCRAVTRIPILAEQQVAAYNKWSFT